MSLFVDDMIIYVENPKELTNKLLKLTNHIVNLQDCCCCSVTESCPTLCDPMNGSTSGFPALHYLPEFTHLHWVSDASQSSHPLLPLSPLALNLFQHQGLFQWISSWYQVAKVLELQLQHQFFQRVFRVGWFPWGLTGLISMPPKGHSRDFSRTTVQKHQFFSLLYGLTCTFVHDYWKKS